MLFGAWGLCGATIGIGCNLNVNGKCIDYSSGVAPVIYEMISTFYFKSLRTSCWSCRRGIYLCLFTPCALWHRVLTK